MAKEKDKLVIQNNILIAEFMGGEPANKVKDNPIAYTFPVSFGHQETWDEGGFVGSGASSCWNIEDLQYHSDWNWLMPVAKKCIEAYHDNRQDIFSALDRCDIEKLHEAVVEFIKWYNKHIIEIKKIKT